MVLVHCFHSSVVIWHHPPGLPHILNDFTLQEEQRKRTVPKDNHPEDLELLCCSSVDCCSNYAVYKIGWQWHWHPFVLCDDPSMDYFNNFNYCCVPITFWKVIRDTWYHDAFKTLTKLLLTQKPFIAESQISVMCLKWLK